MRASGEVFGSDSTRLLANEPYLDREFVGFPEDAVPELNVGWLSEVTNFVNVA
jgi:hypothetical protein